MGYYLRAFCAAEDLPRLKAVLDWSAAQGVELELASDADALDSPVWSEAEVIFSADKEPLVVEVSRARDGDLFSDEVAEFVEFLEDVPDSPEKDRVLEHLRQSKAVVAAQLLADAGDEGATAATTFLTFFVQNSGGMIQADGEGSTTASVSSSKSSSRLRCSLSAQ